eukprot:CAMPEP_0201282332 /NCGR_PEP_ID=MMETSP1317-20130820/5330_1 /ASSEMBLY_ACC=CAM_ASM_000770 /TAXON_ID=187299 /ORGANISM="Undescribed Undescribed, Strain Undescribed" /LENGTH=94 /DNA_ID=CAMNT_0047594631 /DNA_START=165 /DNA_END=449 /DNA_ORIENTATION=+
MQTGFVGKVIQASEQIDQPALLQQQALNLRLLLVDRNEQVLPYNVRVCKQYGIDEVVERLYEKADLLEDDEVRNQLDSLCDLLTHTEKTWKKAP